MPLEARFLRVRGVVQGVGFRPFVFRLARTHGLSGWVLNGADGVEIHLEGEGSTLDTFAADLAAQPPPAARIAEVESTPAERQGFTDFSIRESEHREAPTVRISPDLPVCANCLAELSSPTDRRHGYPYINCTDCGPRFSIILSLPYDRPRTTMRDWPMCPNCAAEYEDPMDRRFHAQPVSCPDCGPHFVLQRGDRKILGDKVAIAEAARLLGAGHILAIKGIGGYHLGCDAGNPATVAALRERKFRKEKPFALMARNLEVARRLIDLSPEAEALLTGPERPIVLAPARVDLSGVAPGNRDLGVMLPYTPLHHLLFAQGAPEVLVMTSANRSNEPIAYEDDDALARLAGLADAFLIGERPIARRVDDSIVRVTALGPAILRRGRGYAPSAVARLPESPTSRPILALGADLKNTITLVVGGEAFVSQHLGDLDHYAAFRAFEETVRDFLAMYEVDPKDLRVAHDLHPQYASSLFASTLEAAAGTVAVQHHRAHIASVIAEHQAFDQRVVGIALDGTGYGDDGTIWGGEIFTGSIRSGFERVAHLRPALLPGGDAAARYPVQAAAGFLAEIENLPDLTTAPFHFPSRYTQARQLVDKNLRTFTTTSTGRLFDTAAALLGFTREIGFEGQAAIWLEQQAWEASPEVEPYPASFDGRDLDFRPLLKAMIEDRVVGRPPAEIARAFHLGLAAGVAGAAVKIARREEVDTVVLSGGVFQNRMLLEGVSERLLGASLVVWTNREVPVSDGGISLGQAALAITRNDLLASAMPQNVRQLSL
jgi:hydrogenase maturation protein HypF